MSSKKEMLDKVNTAAKKRNEARGRAAVNNSVEAFVFEFFKQAEEIGCQPISNTDKQLMLIMSLTSLEEKIKTIDSRANVKIVFIDEGASVQGVTVVWSKKYQDINNIDSELYIDVAEMLFS